MSDFNRIGNPLIAAGIPRLLGVDMPQVNSVSSDVQFTTSPWERPEFWALMGGSLGIGYFEVAATAFQSQAALWNPPSSGVLLIVEGVWINNMVGAATVYSINLINDVGGWTSTGGWGNRDLRRATTSGGSGALAGRVYTRNNAAPSLAAAWLAVFLAAGDSKFTALDAVLPPGWGVQVVAGRSGALLTGAVQGSFLGRERPAPDPELRNL